MQAKHFNLVLKEGIKNEFIVISIMPDYIWENGQKTGAVKGWKLRTVCPSANYDETVIKMQTEIPPLKQDEVNENPVAVSFADLEFSSYYSTQLNKQVYQGTASALKILK